MEEDPPLRLPEIYRAQDETIQAAVQQLTEAAEPAPAREAPSTERRRFEVTVTRVDPEVLRVARELAAGDIGRIVVRDGAAIVANSRQHADLIRNNPGFGIA